MLKHSLNKKIVELGYNFVPNKDSRPNSR